MKKVLDLKDKLELLKLYDRLKREIFRSFDMDSLLSRVVDTISDHSMYNSAWIIKTNGNDIEKLYHSDRFDYGNDLERLRTTCFKETILSDDILIIENKKNYCKGCILRERHDKSVVFSVTLQHRDDIYGVFLANVRPEWSQSIDHHNQFISLGEDISYAIYNTLIERELFEERQKLYKSQNNLQSFINLTNQAVLFTDIDDKIVFASKEIWSLFGVNSSVPLEDLSLDYIFDNRNLINLKSNFSALIRQRLEKSNSVYSIKNLQGKELIIEIKSTLIKGSDGRSESIASTVINITEDINKDIQLQLAKDKYATIFNKAPNGISILDNKGLIVEVNERDCQMLGYRKEEMIGKHISYFFGKEYISAFKSKFKEFLVNGYSDLDLKLIRKDGNEIFVSRSARAIYTTEKEITRIIVITKDNTDIVKANNKLHLFSEVLKQSPSIITLTDLKGNISYVNKRFEEVTGFSSEEVIGLNPRILKSSYYSNEYYAGIWQQISEGNIWRGRFLNIRKDGSKFWEQALISPFYDLNNNIVGYIKAAEEINSLVELENKLEESNDRYHNIFDLVTVPIMIHRDGLLLDLNKAALKFSKAKDKEELLNTNIMQYVHDDFKDAALQRILTMKKTNERQPMVEEVFLNVKGEERNVEVTSSPIMFKGEQAFMVIFEDITERKQWIQVLEDSEQKFRTIFEMNPDAISISTLDEGRLVDVNEVYLSETGYSREELIGNTVMKLNLYKDLDVRDRLVRKIVSEGSFKNEEVEFVIRGGAVKTALVSAKVMVFGDVRYLLFVSHDISDRKLMETELRKAKEIAVENDKLKSSFLANMSHEIRTPLNAIIGFSDLLKEDDISKQDQLRFINIIQNKGDELLMLMNDIIDISKIEAGAIEINIEPILAKSILDNLNDSYNWNIVEKFNEKIEFIIDSENAEDLIVAVDEFRLIQVLNNLINNALKFTVEGEVRLSVKQDETKVYFEIKDTGIGIPEDKLEFIFDRFRQVDVRQDTLVGGTGLGLNISSNLINLMHGSIEVSSELGKGSVFRVILPRGK